MQFPVQQRLINKQYFEHLYQNQHVVITHTKKHVLSGYCCYPKISSIHKNECHEQIHFKNRSHVFPCELENNFSADSNQRFLEALEDKSLRFSQKIYGFYPKCHFTKDSYCFSELVNNFFHRKNNSNCRFSHKLFNALKIVEKNPNLFYLFGVKWITNNVFKVDKFIFGRLLGVTSIDGSLFHQQGNFRSHSFVELKKEEINQLRKVTDDLSDVDFIRVKVLKHQYGNFNKESDDVTVTNCKWKSQIS